MSNWFERKDQTMGDTVSFGARLIASESFKALFREGMGLVEETAAYLDGDGRSESRDLPRAVSLAYATESMRLTTRLMQIASWLLIQRAANEGEMSAEQAQEERAKVRLATGRSMVAPETYEQLPDRLRELIARSERLQERVQLLERHASEAEANPTAASPVLNQLALIRTAFGNEG